MSEQSRDPKIDIGEEQARGAQRVGLIWMLVASLVVVIFVMALVLAYFAGSLHQANSHGEASNTMALRPPIPPNKKPVLHFRCH